MSRWAVDGDQALASNPDGIGTTVPNPEVIRDAVGRANEAGIPVIVFNTADPNAGTADALDTLFNDTFVKAANPERFQ